MEKIDYLVMMIFCRSKVHLFVHLKPLLLDLRAVGPEDAVSYLPVDQQDWRQGLMHSQNTILGRLDFSFILVKRYHISGKNP
jgi:hypothetical protein